LFDRGARDGEGLFETLRLHSRRPFQWERHLERLVLSSAELGFPVMPSPVRLAEAIEQVLEAMRLTDAVVRITVTRGIPGGRPTRAGAWVEAEPLQRRLWAGTRALGARVGFSRLPFDPGPLGRHKTTSRLAYHLAREEARAARADEVILVSPAGQALEGSVSNLLAVVDGEVLTPPLSLGVLPGLTRAFVLEACAGLGIPAHERPLSAHELLGADELMLTNSVQQIVPVATLEGLPIRGREITLRLLEAYRAAVDGEIG
jgi:branched-subunit amino acid aminotransferase/4-amino-4-deoxychorismate lyase